jgi:mRNA interferase MazF
LIIPTRGDLVWLDFDPQAGREQAGRRPAVILSEEDFNNITGFALVCPITSQAKSCAFEVPLPEGLPFAGVVLTDQLKGLDVKNRKIKVVCSVSINSEFMKEDVLRNTRSILA